MPAISVDVSTLATEATLAALSAKVIKADTDDVTITAMPAITGAVDVNNFPATQPVSGTVDVGNFPATQAVSVAVLPLPTGASTLAEQQSQTTLLGAIATNTATGGGVITDILVALRAVLNAIARPFFVTRSGYVRSILDTNSSISTVTTVTTVTNVSQLGGYDVIAIVTRPLTRASWAANVRSLIS